MGDKKNEPEPCSTNSAVGVALIPTRELRGCCINGSSGEHAGIMGLLLRLPFFLEEQKEEALPQVPSEHEPDVPRRSILYRSAGTCSPAYLFWLMNPEFILSGIYLLFVESF